MKRLILLLILSLALISSVDAKQERSQKAKDDFKHSHPCPSNGNDHGACPDYVIDHVIALACGGADAPENMQWQSVEEGKLKDKWERAGCSTNSDSTNRSRNESAVYQTGTRGGCFTYGQDGRKHYVSHDKCGR